MDHNMEQKDIQITQRTINGLRLMKQIRNKIDFKN